jgi:hypothetical protein
VSATRQDSSPRPTWRSFPPRERVPPWQALFWIGAAARLVSGAVVVAAEPGPRGNNSVPPGILVTTALAKFSYY